MKETSGTPDSMANSTNNYNVGDPNNCLNITDYFRSNTNKEGGKRASRLIAMKIHNKFSDIFTGIGCFTGTFNLWMREGSFPYTALSRKVSLCTPSTTMRRAGQTTITTD